MRRVSTAIASGGLLALTGYSFIVLIYDLAHRNFSIILDSVFLRTSSIYHLIATPVRSLGTVIAFIMFLPFLWLFLINSQIALAVFMVIEIATLFVVHIAIMAISIAYLNKALKNPE